jgi:hypothetical protein
MLSLGPSPRLLHSSPDVGSSFYRVGIAGEIVVFKGTFNTVLGHAIGIGGDPATGERIGPSQFSRETGMVVGANSATAQCGERKEDEWQELLARLSTGCKV